VWRPVLGSARTFPRLASPVFWKTCTYGETREFPAFWLNVASLEAVERCPVVDFRSPVG